MEHLQTIQNLLYYLNEYRATGAVTLTMQDQQNLKEVYQSIYKVKPNVSCSTCVLHYLTMLESYYQREYIAPEPLPVEVVPEPLPSPLPKKTKKK